MHDCNIKNYCVLSKFSLLYDHFAFIDTSEYYADQMFIRQRVKVWFGKEYKHPNYPYLIIFCKVRKRDREKFLTALSELNCKMIENGHPAYEKFCRRYFEQS